MSELLNLPLWMGGLLAQSGGAAPGAGWFALPSTAGFYVVFGLSLSLLSLLVVILTWRSERRRMRSGIRMIGEAAARLAEEREYCEVGMSRNRELAALAEAFNRISAQMQEDAARIERRTARLEVLQNYVDRFQTASEELAQLTDATALRGAVVGTLVDVLGFKQANLWLVHRYVRKSAPGEPGDGATPGKEAEAQEILDKVGLVPVCRSAELRGEPGAVPTRLTYRGILEAAMTNEKVVCPRISESPLFRGEGPALAAAGLTAYVAVPMVVRGQLMGVVEVFNDTPPTRVGIQALQMFAARAASLISVAHSSEEMTLSREAYELTNLELQMANRRLQRTNSQLAEADRLKSEFLANTSHELRTPLNSILGFAQLILAGACDSEEELRSNVQAIQESGERLLRLINEVLDLAKIEAGRLNLALSAVDLGPIIDAAVTLLRIQSEAKGIELKVEPPRGELPQLRADGTKLYQVLVNLIGNAVKFTEKGGVTVRMVPEMIPGFMVIEVEDTGIGIEPLVLSRLFQNFVQGDGSVTRRFGGTGLGLAISQKMVDLQGGILSLTSPGVGRGAKARLAIPLWSDRLEEEFGGATERPAVETLKPGRTVVVIEDYLEFQRYLVDLLEERGWSVLTARTARLGLELIQEYGPTAIVLDMYLPWDDEDPSIRSGYDIVKLLGADRELNSTPILIVTGMLREASDRLLTQTVLNPVELYGKPLDEDAFLESLERLTAGAPRMSPASGPR